MYPWVYIYEYTCLDTDAACACIMCQYVCRCELEDLHMLTEIFTYMHNARMDGYANEYKNMCVHVCLSIYAHIYIHIYIYVCAWVYKSIHVCA